MSTWMQKRCLTKEKNKMEAEIKGMNSLAQSIHAINREKGFWDQERNIGEMLMLITSELGEAMEAHRKGKFANWDAYAKALNKPEQEDAFKLHIKDSFEDEITDALIRIMDMAAGLEINLEKHLEAKIGFNKLRPRLHGKKY